MRRLYLHVVVVLLLSSFVASCGASDSEFTIRVTGDASVTFSGPYMVVKADGSSVGKTVESRAPVDYKVTGLIVSVVFQKQTDRSDLLRVQILKGGKVIAEAETRAAYGIASVSTR